MSRGPRPAPETRSYLASCNDDGAVSLVPATLEEIAKMVKFKSRLFAGAAVFTAAVQLVGAAAEITIGDGKAQPESLTIAPGGILIVGSASTPFVYKVGANATTAEKFV